MKKFFLFSFLSLTASAFMAIPATVNAQTGQATTNIHGHVQDEKAEAAAFATVTLRESSDSSLVKGALTDSIGDYQFANIPAGKYFVLVQQTGAGQTYSKSFELTNDQKELNLPTLTLNFQANNLNEVKITAAKPLIEHQPGQTIVNVENSSLSAGNTVLEVLQKSPGVLVDQDDNISLNGKSGVMVMINGRPTHMAAEQLATILKGMPAASVSKIELMTQPPAKYSAEGSAGIINIVLKQQVAMGLNGSLTAGAGYGQFWKYNAGGNLNYRGKKLSVYGSYNFDHRKPKFEMDMRRDFYDPTTNELSSYMDQASILSVASDHHNAQVGMDYYINDKQSIGFVANGDFNSGDFNSNSPVYFKDVAGHTDSVSLARNHSIYNWNNESGNVHYNAKLDDKGSNIAVNADYSHFYQSKPQTLFTQNVDGDGEALEHSITRKGTQPNDINIYAAKVDYTGILSHQYTVEAGLKSSYVHTVNQSDFQINDDGTRREDTGLNNHFTYKENVNAGYLTLSKVFQKGWSAKAGVRAEQTNIQTHQMINDSSNTAHYIDFFPNASLSKVINPDNVLSLSYSRRIDRPDYQSLNPFVEYLDEYTFRGGNPYLKPQYTQSTELGYTFKKQYSATLNYSHTKDVISQVVTQNLEEHTMFQTQSNISKFDNLTLSLNVPVSITRWWQTYNTAQGYYNYYNGLYDGYNLNKGYFSFMLNTYQSFILPHSWKAELTGMYRSSMIMGPFVINPMVLASAGIEKTLCNGKASIKLNVQDIFQSMNFKVNSDFGNLHIHNQFHGYNRSASMTFTWNFGNQKIRVRKYNDTSIKEDEKRIQKGNSNNGI